MKKLILLFLFVTATVMVQAQTTYYWVGGAASANINAGANWNTALNGSGSPRPSSSGATDILVFDGTNFGGATTVTGPITVHANAGITAGQVKFVNNATVSFVRNTTGTTTITIAGEAGDDFVISAGSSVSITSTTGSIVFAMAAANTGTVSGNFSMITPLQARIANTTAGNPGSLVFTAGSTFTTNITAASAAYAFGNASQSSEKWVVFQAGSHLYYDGGYSPFASSAAFMPIDFQPGSTWHHRATNATSGSGVFGNNKSFANLIVENGATFASDGSINRIDTLTVTSGSSFITHSSGATTVRGNMIVDGSFSSQAVQRGNTLLFAGNTPQSISGSGTISIASLTVADGADVSLNKNITGLDTAVTIYGKVNFNNSQLTGNGSFRTMANATVSGLTGSLVNGSQQISAVSGTMPNLLGMSASGAGIPANTVVVGYSPGSLTITLSKPATATGTGVALSFSSDTAILATSNGNGFDPATGSVIVSGNQNFAAGTGYIINGATLKPFGISTGSTASFIEAGTVTINAPVTTNTSVHVLGNFQLNTGKTTIRPLDTIRIISGANLTGNFNASNYFITAADQASGAQGILRIDGTTGLTLFPVGSANHYMPFELTPATVSDFAGAVFTGITANGTPNGAQLTTTQKLTKVDAVWNINRVNGSGAANLRIDWPQALEGSTFSTLPDSDIGIIVNNGTSWALPVTPGDNTANTSSASFTSFGAFGIGAQPPAQAFVFNPLPAKTYGDPDFNGGAISANTSQPIVYTSSNPAVATIVSGNIHIVGVGTTDITASQASDGFYPAASVTQTLTVNKATLTIKADDKAKPQGDPNPVLTATYTGFVLGETPSVLLTPVTLGTTAVTSSPAGTYPITASGATATNYNINFVSGTLTVTPRQTQTITFNPLPTKTYGNNDFAAGGTSSNSTIPVTYTSSNPLVSTIVGNNIHIVGAGTATITASQAGNAFYYPAADVSRTLTVNKANLTIRALDTSKLVGQPNPPFTLTYTGFVLGENANALINAAEVSTTATTNSTPGYYPITVSGATSNNYNITFVNGRLAIYPSTGITQPYIQAFMSSSSTLNVRLLAPAPDLGDVMVFDMTGRLIMKKNVFMAQGFLNYTFDMQVPAPGIYIVKAIANRVSLKTTVLVTK